MRWAVREGGEKGWEGELEALGSRFEGEEVSAPLGNQTGCVPGRCLCMCGRATHPRAFLQEPALSEGH